MDLSNFLLARITEDEAVARAVADEHPSEDWDSYMSSAGFYDRSAHTFAERFNPARVLAECDAKRRIVEWHLRIPLSPLADSPIKWQYIPPVLALLALPYADHPNYREEWKP